MATRLQTLWQTLVGSDSREVELTPVAAAEHVARQAVESVDIAPNDPIVAYFQSAPGVVDIDKLSLDSPALPCPALPCPALPCPALPCPGDDEGGGCKSCGPSGQPG